MSINEALLIDLQWDVQDRLGKSLRVAGVSVQEMADYLDVHRNTVGGWLNGRHPVDVRTLRVWSLRTGVPFEWLRDGDTVHDHQPDPDGSGEPTVHGVSSNPKTTRRLNARRGSRQPVGWHHVASTSRIAA